MKIHENEILYVLAYKMKDTEDNSSETHLVIVEVDMQLEKSDARRLKRYFLVYSMKFSP